MFNIYEVPRHNRLCIIKNMNVTMYMGTSEDTLDNDWRPVPQLEVWGPGCESNFGAVQKILVGGCSYKKKKVFATEYCLLLPRLIALFIPIKYSLKFTFF